MQRLIFIGLAGGLGTLLRYGLSEFSAEDFVKNFASAL
jgi:fluoride ion exporter CrcB/FEX